MCRRGLKLAIEADEIENEISEKKKQILRYVDHKKFSDAMHSVSKLAYEIYEYNQNYTDEFLEHCLQDMESDILIESDRDWAMKSYGEHRMKVTFYDGFGFDFRGLVQIYIRALSKMNVKLQYITIHNGDGCQPILMEVLRECGAEIVYLPDEYKIKLYPDICKYVNSFQPDVAFIYTTPWDVPGVMAFMHFSGKMKRYQINLTDHAFWLGIHAFDYCLEFRDFGASVSNLYRGVPKKSIYVQPYYPFFKMNIGFKGYPFSKKPDDIVIFSGGSLYKIEDEKNTFLNIIRHGMHVSPNVKFWYAGGGDKTYIEPFMDQYKGRAFYTDERDDLFQILQHIDIYISTYPVGGGLMIQYAALAGKAPLILDPNHFAVELLINQDKIGLELLSEDDVKKELTKLISDSDYRRNKNELVKNAIITEEDFVQNLHKILYDGESQYRTNFYKPNIDGWRQVYAEKFISKWKEKRCNADC